MKSLKFYTMLKVLKSGFFNTIQDKGRNNLYHIGIPFSGAMDSYSSDIANSILNNSLDCAFLEITLGGCKLQFLSKTTICSSNAIGIKVQNQPSSILIKKQWSKNDILSFGNLNFGARCYLAVSGGIKSEVKLNSRSFYKGITKNTILQNGMGIPISQRIKGEFMSNSSIKINEVHFKSEEIKCYKGPEFDLLRSDQQKELIEKLYSISKDANRM